MGNTSNQQQFSQLTHSYQTLYQIIDLRYCKVWKSKQTNIEQMQQYTISINQPQLLQSYSSMHQLRTNSSSFVSIYYFTHQQSKQICGIYRKGVLLTQRIPYRLGQLSHVPLQQSLLILRDCFENFKILRQIYGEFLVHSNMIGFNNQWKTKVWIHTQFSSVFPSNPYCKDKSEMIKSIILSVESTLDRPFQLPIFSKYLRENNRLKDLRSFLSIQQAFQSYLRQLRIILPSNLLRLKNIIQDQNFKSQADLSQINKEMFFLNENYKQPQKSKVTEINTSQTTIGKKLDPFYTKIPEHKHIKSKIIQKMYQKPVQSRHNNFFPISSKLNTQVSQVPRKFSFSKSIQMLKSRQLIKSNEQSKFITNRLTKFQKQNPINTIYTKKNDYPNTEYYSVASIYTTPNQFINQQSRYNSNHSNYSNQTSKLRRYA